MIGNSKLMASRYLENGIRKMLLQRRREIKFTLLEESPSFFAELVQKDPSLCAIIDSYEIHEPEKGVFFIEIVYRQVDENINIRNDKKLLSAQASEKQKKREKKPNSKEYYVSSFDELSAAFYDAADMVLDEFVLIAPKEFDIEKHFYWFWETRSSQIPTMITAEAFLSRKSDTTKLTLHPKYRLGRFMLQNDRNIVNREIERLSEQMILSDMPIEAKVFLTHNYLSMSATWVKNHNNCVESQYTQGPYGVLINKQGVCQSFATAFQLIMKKNGVLCFVIRGRNAPFNTEKSGHAWNIVCINGEYYHVDCTWDANKHKPQYDYFCVSDSYLDNRRRWDYAAWPACNGKADIQAVAVSFIKAHKEQLLKNGVDPRILDC